MTIMSEIKSIIIAVMMLVLGLFVGVGAGAVIVADCYKSENDAIENETE